MTRKSFTLIEIMMVILIMQILAAVSIGGWIGIMNKSKELVCEQNQVIISRALKLYIYRFNGTPASLTKLYPEYTDIAIAQLKENESGKLRMRNICLALIDISEVKEAFAQPTNFHDFVSEPSVLKCPCNTGGGTSYAFNSSLTAGDPWQAFEILENPANDFPIICDGTNATFSAVGGIIDNSMATRHSRVVGNPVAVAVCGQTIRLVNAANNWNNPVVNPPKKISR